MQGIRLESERKRWMQGIHLESERKCMLEMKQCSSQDFSPTELDINPAGHLAGEGGGGGREEKEEEEEEEAEGDVRWIAN